MENGTGVEYPTIELGGKSYTVKFTRSTVYRLEKAGIKFNPRFSNGGKTVNMQFAEVVDVLAVCIGWPTNELEDLAELVFDVRDEATRIIVDAWGNLLRPSLERRLAAANKAVQPPATNLPS